MKKLTFITGACGLMMASCALEPMEMPREETYTRDFVKNIGIIDPEQDFNMADSYSVTVDPGDSKDIKVYAKYAGTYYVVAEYHHAQGKTVIPFDAPKGISDVMVEVGGSTFMTTVGGTVDARARSRAVGTGSTSGITVSLSGTYFKFTNHGVNHIIGSGGKLPEGDHSNTEKSGVIKDFMFQSSASAMEYTIYPMFWYTADRHTLGIYYYPDNDPSKPKVEIPLYLDKDYGALPENFYDSNLAIINPQYIVHDGVQEGYQHYMNFNPDNLAYNQSLIEECPDGTYSSGTPLKMPPMPTRVVYHIQDKRSDTEIIAAGEVKPDNTARRRKEVVMIYDASETPDLSNYYRQVYTNQINLEKAAMLLCDSVDANNVAVRKLSYVGDDRGNYGTMSLARWFSSNAYYDGKANFWNPTKAYPFNNSDPKKYYRSQGFKITVPPGLKFGFYIELGMDPVTPPGYNPPNGNHGRKIYSQSVRNDQSYAGTMSYAVTFTDKSDYDGDGSANKEKRFFAFEDWLETAGSDKDVNDLIFMIEGVEEVVTDTSMDWLIAMEDLGSSDDFDFNDVVLGVTTKTVDGIDGSAHKKLTFTALAAGGTLPIYLHFPDDLYWLYDNNSAHDVLFPRATDNGGDTSNGGTPRVIESETHRERREFHSWFGDGTINSRTMINTGTGVSAKGLSCVVWAPGTFSMKTYGVVNNNPSTTGGFYATVGEEYPDGWAPGSTNEDPDYDILTQRRPGSAPQMFVIPDVGFSEGMGWCWPRERAQIYNVYPRFLDWVRNRPQYGENDVPWHQDPPQALYWDRKIGGVVHP